MTDPAEMFTLRIKFGAWQFSWISKSREIDSSVVQRARHLQIEGGLAGGKMVSGHVEWVYSWASRFVVANLASAPPSLPKSTSRS